MLAPTAATKDSQKITTNVVGPSAEVIGTEGSSPIGTLSLPPQSAGALAASDLPAKVKVSAGDSLWRLAQRYLGNGLRWRRLALLNPQLADPSRILVGEWIILPSDRKKDAKEVIVQPGDTLWRVAENQLGSPPALNCLAQANPQLRSLDLVHAGEVVVVPASCGDPQKTQN